MKQVAAQLEQNSPSYGTSKLRSAEKTSREKSFQSFSFIFPQFPQLCESKNEITIKNWWSCSKILREFDGASFGFISHHPVEPTL